jgi:peptidoglycan/LPS O-acetylase OafA/YrhL
MTGTIYGILPPAYTVIYHMAGAFLLTAGVLGSGSLQRIFSWKPFGYLGKVSYSLYLLHFPVIATASCGLFLALYPKLGYHLTAGIDFLVTTALVLLVSTLSQRYLEPLGRKLEDRVAGGVK